MSYVGRIGKWHFTLLQTGSVWFLIGKPIGLWSLATNIMLTMSDTYKGGRSNALNSSLSKFDGQVIVCKIWYLNFIYIILFIMYWSIYFVCLGAILLCLPEVWEKLPTGKMFGISLLFCDTRPVWVVPTTETRRDNHSLYVCGRSERIFTELTETLPTNDSKSRPEAPLKLSPSPQQTFT